MTGPSLSAAGGAGAGMPFPPARMASLMRRALCSSRKEISAQPRQILLSEPLLLTRPRGRSLRVPLQRRAGGRTLRCKRCSARAPARAAPSYSRRLSPAAILARPRHARMPLPRRGLQPLSMDRSIRTCAWPGADWLGSKPMACRSCAEISQRRRTGSISGMRFA